MIGIPNIVISPAIAAAAPGIGLGVIAATNIQVLQSSDALLEQIEAQGAAIQQQFMNAEVLSQAPAISAARDAYRSLGNDPSRYRGSAEALCRRCLSGKPLYRVNNVVEVNNLISLSSLLPVGSYDSAKIHGDIAFRVGQPGETYKAIGNKELNLEGLPIFSDGIGPFGSPTSDSERTMITPQTTSVLTIIISFLSFQGEDTPLARAIELAKELFRKYLFAEEVEVRRI